MGDDGDRRGRSQPAETLDVPRTRCGAGLATDVASGVLPMANGPKCGSAMSCVL